jgi:hypothetical protein
MPGFLNSPLLVIFTVSVIAFACAIEIGHRLGVGQEREANVTTLEASMLGLLALMLGFTFSMALTRFDARRDALLSEANAIGTAALRARLLPSPHDSQSLQLFRDYVQVRLTLFSHSPSGADLDEVVIRSNKLQDALWRQAKAVAVNNNAMVPTGLFIQALNETFDNQEKRLTALRNHVPAVVYFALYGIAWAVMGFAGFASGVDKRSWRMPVYLTAAVVAFVILLIEDLDQAGAGFIVVNQQPMLDVANAISSYPIEASQPAAKGSP